MNTPAVCQIERQIVVAGRKRQKRSVLDDIVEGMRRLLEDLDTLLHPEKIRRPVPVPVPVRPDPRRNPRNPYRP